MNCQSIILSKRWEHHTKSGGYDRLADELQGSSKVIQTRKSNRLPSLLKKRIFQKIVPSSKNVNHYLLEDFLSELRVFKHIRNSGCSIVHALYGEDQLNLLLSNRNRVSAALTGTFHLPAESPFITRITERGAISRFSQLDSAVVVSRNMIADYEYWVGKGNVYFVPHGINASAFSPDEVNQMKPKSSSETLNVLIVGGHGRDWDTVSEVVKWHSDNNANISYEAVLPYKSIADKFSKGIRTHIGIEESRLIDLYRSADVLFIPVNYATANNSLLESLACGTPVISTNTGGIPDYLDNSSGWLLPKGDVRSAAELLSDLAEHPEKVLDKRTPAREQALKFTWNKVAAEIQVVYLNTIEKWKKSRNNKT
jgi:glycosyltransferase involved in cell wall biosynthesis